MSLQKHEGEGQIDANRAAAPVTVLAGLDATAPFVDTAAVMEHLDLVVTSDTAIAHLAGALGRPVWVALGQDCDWRWGTDRDDSPWYPTMRLFRQTAFHDWHGVFAAMSAALQKSGLRRVSRESEANGAHHSSESVGLARSVPSTNPACPIAAGELIDKITILEIKLERIAHAVKVAHVRREYDQLRAAQAELAPPTPELTALAASLKAVNERLWDIEDEIRMCETEGDFGPRFVALARSVYKTNDERADLKRQINDCLGSAIVEVKSYRGN